VQSPTEAYIASSNVHSLESTNFHKKKGHDTPRVLVCTQKTVVDQDWTPVKFLYKKSKRQQENDYT
jgi:hypothetical protein